MAKKQAPKNLTRQVLELNKKAICKAKVVSLKDYKEINKKLKNNKTILVVDDEAVILNVVKRIFEKENYRVLTAKDGMEFSKMMQDIRVDLILLDINLPWVNGYELCSLLKSNPLLNQVPVVFISGNTTEEDIKRGFDVGCDDYVKKPFEVTDLQNVVEKLLIPQPVAG